MAFLFSSKFLAFQYDYSCILACCAFVKNPDLRHAVGSHGWSIRPGASSVLHFLLGAEL
jgi:hypothetical protein